MGSTNEIRLQVKNGGLGLASLQVKNGGLGLASLQVKNGGLGLANLVISPKLLKATRELNISWII